MNSRVVICPFANFGSPGAQQGAESLADALHEMLDDVAAESRPTRARAYQDRVNIYELEFSTQKEVGGWLETARREARSAFASGDFVIWIGGNHLSLLPVYEELARSTSSVVQFDAHLDVYNLSDSPPELNHGNFLRHAAKLPSIVNVGHRDLFLPPAEIGQTFDAALSAVEVARDPAAVEAALTKATRSAKRLFIDIDCDVFDPAYFPAVAHPLPFGLSPATLLRFIEAIWSKKVAGIGISEFDPGRDRADQSLATLIWIVEYLLLRLHGG